MPETLVREYKPKPEDFLKKEKQIFWRGERGNPVAHSVLAPPSRARTSPIAGGSETSEAPYEITGFPHKNFFNLDFTPVLPILELIPVVSGKEYVL